MAIMLWQTVAHKNSTALQISKETISNRSHASDHKQSAVLCRYAPFDAPHESKAQKEHRYSGLAHGVEAEGDEGQAEVGQANVQPSANAIWEHCMAHTGSADLT